MLTRRKFIEICTTSTLGFTLSSLLLPHISFAQQNGKIQRIPTIWLELGSCTGNSVSFDNTLDPGLKRVFLKLIELRYHWIFSGAQGERLVQALLKTVKEDAGEFLLVIEGAPQTKAGGKFCYTFAADGKPQIGLEVLKSIGPKAKWVIALGSCAAFGGPAAARPNPTGATGVWKVLDRPVINVPGCPAHPDWFVGTLAHLLLYGMPEVDKFNRPKMFYGTTIHDRCQRRQLFEDGIFASYPGESGCLFKVGCKGPVTHADCPLREWNNHVNWPVKASTPCIGCTAPEFPDGMMPFLNHLPDIKLPGITTKANTLGMVAGGAAIGGVAVHLVGSVLTGRFHKAMVTGTQPKEKAKQQKQEQQLIMDKLDFVISKQQEIWDQQQKLGRHVAEKVVPDLDEIAEEMMPMAKKNPKIVRKGFWGRLRGLWRRS